MRWLVPERRLDEPGLFLYLPWRATDMPKLRAFIDTARDVHKIGSKRLR
jgi:hypothetical protein